VRSEWKILESVGDPPKEIRKGTWKNGSYRSTRGVWGGSGKLGGDREGRELVKDFLGWSQNGLGTLEREKGTESTENGGSFGRLKAPGLRGDLKGGCGGVGSTQRVSHKEKRSNRLKGFREKNPAIEKRNKKSAINAAQRMDGELDRLEEKFSKPKGKPLN